MKQVSRWQIGLSGLYLCLLVGYAVFSFALTDPNLTLTSWPAYQQFQTTIWQKVFLNSRLLTQLFVGLISAMLISYGLLLKHHTDDSKPSSWKHICWLAVVFSLPLLISYNALSHDVFNYMFNAKMVITYQANPHTQVALDFANDPWTRFMHNTHTPAPYGYGWTGISLLPYSLTTPIGHRFLPTWLLYRGLAGVSLILTAVALGWVARRTNRETNNWWTLAAIVWSPLVLLEIISNMHNDLWMIAPAIICLGLVAKRQAAPLTLAGSLLLLGVSISIKLATVVLLPLWFLLAIQNRLPLRWQERLNRFWPLLASISLFAPLLTGRSQQFHPWYLVWSLSWMALFGNRTTKNQQRFEWFEKVWMVWLLALSATSLYRYGPWLQLGYFTPEIVWQQKVLTWVPAIVITLLWCIVYKLKSQAARSST